MASSISLWVSTLSMFAVQVLAGLVFLAAGGDDGDAVCYDGHGGHGFPAGGQRGGEVAKIPPVSITSV
jgi:hypothetical protein